MNVLFDDCTRGLCRGNKTDVAWGFVIIILDRSARSRQNLRPWIDCAAYQMCETEIYLNRWIFTCGRRSPTRRRRTCGANSPTRGLLHDAVSISAWIPPGGYWYIVYVLFGETSVGIPWHGEKLEKNKPSRISERVYSRDGTFMYSCTVEPDWTRVLPTQYIELFLRPPQRFLIQNNRVHLEFISRTPPSFILSWSRRCVHGSHSRALTVMKYN